MLQYPWVKCVLGVSDILDIDYDDDGLPWWICKMRFANDFEKFTNSCYDNFDFDLCYYISTLALWWDALLKTTGVETRTW